MISSAEFLDLAIREKLWSNKKNLKNYLSFMFDDVDVAGKRVLDVGGGDGLLTFYAAALGAQNVVCLEPEFDGSTQGVNDNFLRFKRSHPAFAKVDLETVQLQEYESSPFDIIMLSNVINHLDEDACIELHRDDAAALAYRKIFSHINSLMLPGAVLLATDCTRSNFYNAIGVSNPFMPDIEWHKHQSPSVWSQHLALAGFENTKIRWSSFNRFGKWGRVILGNKIGAYFTLGHFLLRMSKPA